MRRIVLDIGHGSDTFPPSKGVYINKDTLSATEGKAWEEHTFNSKVAEKTREKLKEYEDVEVLFTQTPHSKEVKLLNRTNQVRKWNAERQVDLLISIHANAHLVNSPAKGYCSFYWMSDRRTKAFLTLWHEKMKRTGMKDRGIIASNEYKYNFHILRETPCSAVLLEHFFFTNYEELMKWGFEEGVEIFSEILTETILEYFGLEKKKKSTLTVNVFGEDKEMDYVFADNRNYVSIRELAEAMGAAVEWDHARKKVFIFKRRIIL